jgi:lipopolysaccharide export LptBFGC system permease protein LptF
MRLVDSLELRGANRWRDSYPDRAKYGDQIANMYGVARIWKRFAFWTYVVAFALLLIPVGHALHYVGSLVFVFGLAPLICWFAERMKFRKAIKLATE